MPRPLLIDVCPRRRAAVLERLGRPDAPLQALHLAVLTEPFLTALLAGRKTWESRFGVVRAPPYGKVRVGDLVVVKAAGGNLVATFVAGEVVSRTLPTFAHLNALVVEYGARLCITNDFHTSLADRAVKYATLVRVDELNALNPSIRLANGSRAGWELLR